MPPPRNLNVVTIAYDQLCAFEFGVATEVFGLPRPEFDEWYRFRVVAADPPPLRARGGFEVHASGDLRPLSRAGTIVVPGWRRLDEPPPEALLRALRRAHHRGARILSICSGVFVLAAAGLVDGKRVTTHWLYADELARRFPTLDVDPDVLYVDEGSILTSAGSAAGIDLCLHLVRRDFGPTVANTVARRLVMAPHREGGQAQFVSAPLHEERDTSLAELLDWIRDHLHQPLTVPELAKRIHMTPRTFARKFTAAAGSSPVQWILRERVRRAQDLLETTDDDIERIATRSGFGEAQLLRHHFRRHVGTTPTAYRRSFERRTPVVGDGLMQGS